MTHHHPRQWGLFWQVTGDDRRDVGNTSTTQERYLRFKPGLAVPPSASRGTILLQDSSCLPSHSSGRRMGPVSADARGLLSKGHVQVSDLCLYPAPASTQHHPVHSLPQELCHRISRCPQQLVKLHMLVCIETNKAGWKPVPLQIAILSSLPAGSPHGIDSQSWS